MRFLLPLCALLAACPGPTEDTEPDEETPEEITARKFAELINVSTAPIAADASCWTGGDAWLVQDVDEAKQVDEARTVEVADFETGDPVEAATLNVYLSDDPGTTPDLTGTSDVNGEMPMTLPACTPFAYKVTTPPELDATKDTFESHQVFAPVALNDDSEVNSVSMTTFALIPSLLGVSIDEDKSIIAGGLQDCNNDPIEGGQVVVRGPDGNIPDSLIVKYFVEDFPSRVQPTTSADGLWVAMNVPAGTWTVEAYVSDGAGGHTLAGTTELTAFEGSINISNIYWGREGGIYYPSDCLAAAEPPAR